MTYSSNSPSKLEDWRDGMMVRCIKPDDPIIHFSHPVTQLTLDAENSSKLFLPIIFFFREIRRHGQKLKPARIQLG